MPAPTAKVAGSRAAGPALVIVYSTTKVDDENRLWVSTLVEDFDIYEWWVLNEYGKLFARFPWPRNEPIEGIKNSYMYTRETEEETGLQRIARYRIERSE